MKKLAIVAWYLLVWLLVVPVLVVTTAVTIPLLGVGYLGKFTSEFGVWVVAQAKRIAPFLLLVALSGCAAGSWLFGKASHDHESFTYWTRFYEARMGLEESPIRFGPTPGARCAEVGWELWMTGEGVVAPRTVTYFDWRKCSPKRPWEVALHEACHRRLMHHVPAVQRDLATQGVGMEDEVKGCERQYLRKGLRP